MKIKIEYDFWCGDYRAWTLVNGTPEVGLSDKSFDDAKNKLIAKIQEVREREPIPEPEEIEI